MEPKAPVGDVSAAKLLGMFFGLATGGLGSAVAVVGGLWTAFSCLSCAHHFAVSVDDKWKYYLIAGGLFVAILVACRWPRRA